MALAATGAAKAASLGQEATRQTMGEAELSKAMEPTISQHSMALSGQVANGLQEFMAAVAAVGSVALPALAAVVQEAAAPVTF
jgi:hypothetical protein